MNTLEIDVSKWPPEWIELVKSYTEGLTAKFEADALSIPGVEAKAELPDWPGSASVPPEKLRREELYKDENEWARVRRFERAALRF